MLITLKRIRRRMSVNRVASLGVRALFWGVCAGCVAVFAHKLFPLPLGPTHTAGIIAGAAVAIGLIGGLFARPSLLEAAVSADKSAELRERISSAYILADRGESMSMVPALVEDANAAADGIDVRREFPIKPPSESRFLVIPLALYFLVWGVMPELDPFGRREQLQARRVAIKRARAQIVKLEQLSHKIRQTGKGQKIDLKAKELAKEIDEAVRELREHDLYGKKAMARVSKLSDAIRKRREELKSKGRETIPAKLPVGRPDDFKLMQEIAQKLKEGQFEAAAKKLGDLAKALEKQKLSGKDMKRLQKELKMMSERLKKMPGLRKTLQKAAASLSDKDVRKALEQMQMAKVKMEDMKAAQDQLEMMEEAFGKVAKIKRGFGGEPRRWQFCRNCGAQLRTEQEIWSGFCERCRLAGLERQEGGGGFGGPGIGRGGNPGEIGAPPVDFESSKIRGMLGKGKILGVMTFRGEGEKGEVTVDYVETFMEYRQKAEDALEKEEIPHGYKDYVRQYFDAVKPAEKQKTGN